MKKKANRGFSMLIAVLLVISLLPMTVFALEEEAAGTTVYTSPDGRSAGEYYFDMDSGELYDCLKDRRYDEKISDGAAETEAEAYAAEAASADLAAFKAAAWSVNTESLALSADFPAGYDPSAIFSLQDDSDRTFMLSLMRLAGEASLPWAEAPMPQSMNELPEYGHGQYYINTQMVYDYYFDAAYAEYSAHPEIYDWADEWELGSMCDAYAVGKLKLLWLATYHVLPDEPIFGLRQTWGEDGNFPLYFPYDTVIGTEGAEDDLSRFVMEYHDYKDPVWDWESPDHVTVTFECFLGTEEHGDGTGDKVVFELTGDDITQTVLREPTELTDGEVECTASVEFMDSRQFKVVTFTDTEILTSPAKGDPDRLEIREQPQSVELSYPQGATFHVEVAGTDNVEAASYQWYDTDALGRPVKLDGLSATTDTLVLPSTTLYDSYFDLFCVITDTNGNKVKSDTAHVEMVDRGHRPVFYVGDIAVQPGETLDLSTTEMGTGTVTFEGNEVTLDNVVIDLDKDHLLFDTINSPEIGLFAACSGCPFENDEFYIHVMGDCEINSNYYDQSIYSAGICLRAHFRASDADTDTTMIIDGDGTLTLHGGCGGINTDYALEINGNLNTQSNGQYYMEGIYANGDVRIGEEANVDIQCFGPGIFVDCRLLGDWSYEYHDIYISDGAKVKIDATAGHVYSRNTDLYGIVANGDMFFGAADLDISLHAIPDTMIPYDGRVSSMTGLTAFNIVLEGTGLSIDIDAVEADGKLYANGAYGISGDSLQRLYLTDGAKAGITIDTPVVRDVAEGIESAWTWQDEGLGIVVEKGCELNIDISSTGTAVFGIDLANPVYVADGVMNVTAESPDADMVFGVSCSEADFELNSSTASVCVNAPNGIAIFTSDSGDDTEGNPDDESGLLSAVEYRKPDAPREFNLERQYGLALSGGLASGVTEYDPDYAPKHILLSGKAEITTPKNGLVSRYGFPYYGNLVPGETVYDPKAPDTPASEVQISVKANSGGGSSGGDSSSSSYTVTTADAENGSVTVKPPSASKGTTVTITPTPDEGYEVDKITVTDGNGNAVSVRDNGDGTYSFIMPDGKVTVAAAFREKTHDCPSKDFTDVDPDAWYHEAVDYAVAEGLMNGVGNGKFDPDGTTTRAMIVTILHRLEGTPVVNAVNPFDDVAADQWYTDAVIWANANGIVEGYGDGMFGPADNITREQFAAILYRYANYKDYDTGKTADLSAYEDALSISSWALDAVKWANAEALITGRTATTLVPTGNTTRAEAATILMRLISAMQ
ncbi:MAG: S-layer homology domain-containing protein [Oscillospiraceae bacterium]|nr:S-layer homology domain-containing protein [Oscillospiraceae bacterium]